MIIGKELALGIFWLCMLASRAVGAEDGGPALVFRDARVFDGEKLIQRATVVVRDGKIAAIAEHASVPDGARVIDGSGKTLLPGLIDSHTHVFGPDVLRAALMFGVTTELDMFTSTEVLKEIRKELAEEDRLKPGLRTEETNRLKPGLHAIADLRSAGILVTAPGGHGTEYGLPIPTISSAAEAQAFVDARIAEGSDYIKIVYDSGEAYGIHFPTLDVETLKAVIAAAHARKKIAVVHIGSLRGAREAIEAGADGLAHLFIDREPDAEFGRLVAAHHAFVVPTLAVLESVSGRGGGNALAQDAAIAPYLSAGGRTDLERGFPMRAGADSNYSAAEKALRQLRDTHVAVLAGTDAPNPGTTHGASLHRELELLVNGGLTPSEALAAATSVPAKRFGLEDRGAIAPGKRADLLLVEGDPTADIKATRKIAGVWKAGVAVDREGYRAELEKQRTDAKRLAKKSGGDERSLVSDFDSGTTASSFGMGWQVSTDSLRGGKSTASLTVVEPGAEKSKGALLVEGEVDGGLPYGWSGAIFFPGDVPMSPVDLSAKKGISFWAKGDGRTYSVMVFAQSKGFMPVIQTFVPEAEWRRFAFKLKDFEGYDGHDLMGLFIGASAPAGKFKLQIDEVRFE